MHLFFYIVFAILILLSILFVVSVLTTTTTNTIEPFLPHTKHKQNTYMKKIHNKVIDLENNIMGSIKHVQKGVGNIAQTLANVNRMQNDETYDEDVNVLFDDDLLTNNAEQIRQNIIQEYDATPSSEKNIRILNFVIFDKQETTPQPYTAQPSTDTGSVFHVIRSYSNQLRVINSELTDLLDASVTLSEDQQTVLNKLKTKIKKENDINVVKKIKSFRKKYLTRGKNGEIGFHSKIYKDWVSYYPDNDFFTNDDLHAFLKRRVVALVDVLDLNST